MMQIDSEATVKKTGEVIPLEALHAALVLRRNLVRAVLKKQAKREEAGELADKDQQKALQWLLEEDDRRAREAAAELERTMGPILGRGEVAS